MSATQLLPAEAISMAQAAQQIPNLRPGKRTRPTANPKTIARWAMRGLRVPGGSRIKLKAFRVGTVLYTTQADLHRFIAATTLAHDVEPSEDITATLAEEEERRLDEFNVR